MALNIENIVAELENATILELSELVKAIEEKFDVTAAAPVAAAAGAGEAAAAKDSFDVELTAAGDKKVAVIKKYVESLVLDLKKLKNSLMVHQQLLKKVFLNQKLTKSKKNLKQLVLQSHLNKNCYQFEKTAKVIWWFFCFF